MNCPNCGCQLSTVEQTHESFNPLLAIGGLGIFVIVTALIPCLGIVLGLLIACVMKITTTKKRLVAVCHWCGFNSPLNLR
jgi:hypothetical protein